MERFNKVRLERRGWRTGARLQCQLLCHGLGSSRRRSLKWEEPIPYIPWAGLHDGLSLGFFHELCRRACKLGEDDLRPLTVRGCAMISALARPVATFAAGARSGRSCRQPANSEVRQAELHCFFLSEHNVLPTRRSSQPPYLSLPAVSEAALTGLKASEELGFG